MERGVEIFLIDGSSESFDPVNWPDDFRTTENGIEVEISNGYKYNFDLENISKIRWYEICSACGYELTDNTCRNLSCDLSIGDL